MNNIIINENTSYIHRTSAMLVSVKFALVAVTIAFVALTGQAAPIAQVDLLYNTAVWGFADSK